MKGHEVVKFSAAWLIENLQVVFPATTAVQTALVTAPRAMPGAQTERAEPLTALPFPTVI